MTTIKSDDHGTCLDPADLSLGIEDYDNELMPFGDAFGADGEPLFPADWDLQDQSPPYDGLYSTPLSWDPPQAKPLSSGTIYPALNALSLEQQEKLCSIAMPDQYNYGSKHSPQSTSSLYKSSVSSPEGPDNSRKRKSSAEADEEDEEGSDKHPPVKKTAHNMIEKRYRTNLNDKISALRDSVPSLRVMSKGSGNHSGEEDLQGLTPAHKLNKATVLSKATEYIKHLEKRNARLSEDNAAMKARLSAFEKLFMAGTMGLNSQQQMPKDTYMDSSSSKGSSPQCVDPQGMIQVPDDMRRLHGDRINSQVYMNLEENYQNQHVQAQNNWQQRGNGGFFGKLMVGSLAGLMIMEGFGESEQSGDTPAARGLFAIPTQVIGSLRSVVNTFEGNFNVLGFHFNMVSLKLFLVLASLCYIILPSLFNLKPKKPSGKESALALAPAPHLGSPIHVRRKAWLTATQSIWIPRNNFIMEAFALMATFLKLALRRLIGAYGYTLLTGVTDEQEAARIKAWEIALDAQLAGGDDEVSKSRLILTLIASGTLPDTPTRLMLKAVHIRVLLLEYANAGFKGFFMFEELAAKLARWKWNEAKQLQKLLSSRSAGTVPVDPLPDHLASLLAQDCDDVLVESVGQRAWNLVWNVPTAYKSSVTGDAMDSVVDDSSIRSPLDAVAAWFSCIVLQRALAKSLKTDADEDLEKSIKDDLDLALKTSPPGSGIHVRVLVAKAIILDKKRGHNIATAFQFIAPAGPTEAENKSDATLVTTTTTMPSFVDIKVSLRCAAAIAYLKRPSPPPENLEVLHKIVNGLKLPTRLSLLSFTAAFKLMIALDGHKEASASCSKALENLAGRLRIWIGGADGKKSGLEKAVKEKVVETCLNINRKAMGMDDAGYGSMSDGEGC